MKTTLTTTCCHGFKKNDWIYSEGKMYKVKEILNEHSLAIRELNRFEAFFNWFMTIICTVGFKIKSLF